MPFRGNEKLQKALRKRTDKPSPFNPDGTLKDKALNNLVVAFLLRAGGSVTFSPIELESSNNRQYTYGMTHEGTLELSLIERKAGTA